MNFLVVTNAPTFYENKKYTAYAPYVNEMDIWFSKVEKVAILSPNYYPDKVYSKEFRRQDILYFNIPFLYFNSIAAWLKAIFTLPYTIIVFIKAFLWADHIHIRCPGNIGLIACVVQVFFPKTSKTVKYAGNWDPHAKQPWSYNFQKWILGNTFLSKNIKVLIYGKWQNQSKNIIPFFTASFSESEKGIIKKQFSTPYKFIFVGTLNEGKRPFFALNIIENLLREGIPVILKIYGNGVMKNEIEEYITHKNLEPFVQLMGNVNREELKGVYKKSHFLILASKSEGWPKAIAEAMFFGCIPIATNISCISWMLNYGKRGILIPAKVEDATKILMNEMTDLEALQFKSLKAQKWSQKFTLEKFEEAIEDILASTGINKKSSSFIRRGEEAG